MKRTRLRSGGSIAALAGLLAAMCVPAFADLANGVVYSTDPEIAGSSTTFTASGNSYSGTHYSGFQWVSSANVREDLDTTNYWWTLDVSSNGQVSVLTKYAASDHTTPLLQWISSAN